MAQEEGEKYPSGIGAHRLLQETLDTQPLVAHEGTGRKAGGRGVRVAGVAA